MSRCFLLVVVVVLAACSSSKKGSDEPPGKPFDAAERFFEAIEKRDCAALTAGVGGSLMAIVEKDGCNKVFELYEHDNIKLIGAVSTKKDGRPQNGYIVTIRVSLKGKQKPTIVQVGERDGRWVLNRI